MTDISACIIARDEESTLEECLLSIRPHVSEIVVVDTGSIDRTPEIARKYADVVEVFLDCNNVETGLIENFSTARNRSFELASHEWVFWIDADDVLEGGEHLRRLAAEAKDDNVLILAPYEYAFDAEGRCVDLHYRERLMRPRHLLEWRFPVHEGCMFRELPDGAGFSTSHSDAFRIKHRSHISTKPREAGRNLRILKEYVRKVGENEPRALFYLGREYGMQGDVGNAVRVLKRYVELSHWDDEKCCAQLELAKLYQRIGDHDAAVEWGLRAIATKSWPDPYWALAKSFYCLADMGVTPEYNYRRAAHFARIGLSLVNEGPQTVLFNNPRARFEIHIYLNAILSRLGDVDGAIASCEEGLKGLPDDEMLRKNLEMYRVERSRRAVLRESDALVKAGALDAACAAMVKEMLNGNVQVVPDSAGAAPEELQPTETLRLGARAGRLLDADADAGARESARLHGASGDDRGGDTRPTSGPPKPGCLDIIFFLGPALEYWSPVTFAKTGLGGSETMAWEMARRLAARGHRVRLFGHCKPTQQGMVEGVEYLDSSRYRRLSCDVLISSRRPDAADDVHAIKAGCRVLWIHDVHCGEELTMQRALRFDRILCLSEWHRDFVLSVYRGMDPAKVLVTRNGIDLKRFEQQVERNPHRAIYSSSPDRGLQTAIDIWPKVRESVPDAELHIFYGFYNWQRATQMYLAAAQARKDQDAIAAYTSTLRGIRQLEHVAKHTAGVVFHDRVNQQQLAVEFLKSGVWAYPTWFQETSCITAMEAQAAGCLMVTSPIAALNETVGSRGIRIGKGEPDEWRSPEYMDHFAEAVAKSMRLSPGTVRYDLQSYARENFCLDKLADDWSRMLTEIHRDVAERVVAPFHAEVA